MAPLSTKDYNVQIHSVTKVPWPARCTESDSDDSIEISRMIAGNCSARAANMARFSDAILPTTQEFRETGYSLSPHDALAFVML
jgi:hypothetical protein